MQVLNYEAARSVGNLGTAWFAHIGLHSVDRMRPIKSTVEFPPNLAVNTTFDFVPEFTEAKRIPL